jgi:hypothetical protein
MTTPARPATMVAPGTGGAVVKCLVLSLSGLAVASALAQAVPKEFPAEGTTAPAAALKERFAGKVYAATLADGTRWRIDYKSNGYFFVDTSTGFRGSGDWHTDDGKLCSRLRGANLSCNEVREVGEVIYLKRDSGEVIALLPK